MSEVHQGASSRILNSKLQVQVGVIKKIGRIFSDSTPKVAPVRRLFGGGAGYSRQLQPCIESFDWHSDIRFGIRMRGMSSTVTTGAVSSELANASTNLLT